MLIGAAFQLKAQSMQIQPFNDFKIKPFSKPPDNFYRKYLDKMPDSLKLITPELNIADSKNNKLLTNKYAYNPMPIVKTEGRSNMPVIKMQGNSKMPVVNPDARVIIIQPGQMPEKP